MAGSFAIRSLSARRPRRPARPWRTALVALLAACGLGAAPASASVGQETGLALPRFVSIKPAHANVRIGPGIDYPAKWTYAHKGLPVEIVQEYGNWRRIRDWQGQEGWVHHSLLSGRRTGLVSPWTGAHMIPLRAAPRADAPVLARLQPKVLVRLLACDRRWCEVKVKAFDGYLPQSALWGVYPNELIQRRGWW